MHTYSHADDIRPCIKHLRCTSHAHFMGNLPSLNWFAKVSQGEKVCEGVSKSNPALLTCSLW